jgi:ribose-phosphate pyrophosphokinase
VNAILFGMPGNEDFARRLAELTGSTFGSIAFRRFPDGESYLRFDTAVEGRPIILVCSLNAPDEKTLPLLFAAQAARELGAARVGLVAPYLAYMRQDKRFHTGEAITSRSYAGILSAALDWMVTVDPHLHRRASMAEIYSIPVSVCHAAPMLADWIKQNIPDALVIGPDVESEQWAGAIAGGANVPQVVLTKTRLGDRDVRIEFPNLERWRGKIPVLVDDIISSGRTMEVAIKQLGELGFAPPICLGVHGLFAEDAYQRLIAAGAARIVSTNTVVHHSNGIDVSNAVAAAIEPFLRDA